VFRAKNVPVSFFLGHTDYTFSNHSSPRHCGLIGPMFQFVTSSLPVCSIVQKQVPSALSNLKFQVTWKSEVTVSTSLE
jgi:hypothetical protein